MAHRFSVQQVKAKALCCRQCFELYAENGLIQNDAQLRYVMRSLGFLPTVAETKAYISENDGRLHFSAFLRVLHKEKLRSDPIMEVKAAIDSFNAHSKSNSSISRQELIVLLSSLSERMPKQEIETILSRMDLTSDKIPTDRLIHQLSLFYQKL